MLLVALALPASAPAAARDRNHDGIPDRWERAHHLTLRVNQAKRDQDHDGLVNRSEYLDHTDPHRRDSDRDGVPDGREDADHDGITNAGEQEHAPSAAGDAPASPPHTEPMGTVAYFEDGDLDVHLADGSDVVAVVDDETRLQCVPPIEHPTTVTCPIERLVPGTRVLAARQSDGHWDLVVLRSAAGDGATVAPQPPAGDTPPPPPPPPPPPAAPAAPASTGTVTAVGEHAITITRPSGEVVPGVVGTSTLLRCIRVADGHVVSNEPCSPSHLAVGRQVALAQRGYVDGVWTWTTISLIEPAG
jgi:hypothetical protein